MNDTIKAIANDIDELQLYIDNTKETLDECMRQAADVARRLMARHATTEDTRFEIAKRLRNWTLDRLLTVFPASDATQRECVADLLEQLKERTNHRNVEHWFAFADHYLDKVIEAKQVR